MQKLLMALILAGALTGCTSRTDFVPMTFHYTPPEKQTPGKQDLATFFKPDLIPQAAPSFPSGFNCLAVNVVGFGIVDSIKGSLEDGRIPSILGGASCSYPGVISAPFSPASPTTLTLMVPRGDRRVIQVVGMNETGTTLNFCQDGVLDSCNGTAGCGEPKVYELGRAVVDAFNPLSVGITNTYTGLSEAGKESRKVNCGGQSITQYKHYVYVASDADEKIYAFEQSTTDGTLTSLASTYTVQAGPKHVVATANGQFLYIMSLTSPPVIQPFTIGTDGLLTALTTTTLSTGYDKALAIHPNGQWLYVADPTTVQKYPIQSTGTLGTGASPVSASSCYSGAGIYSLSVNSTNGKLYGSCGGSPSANGYVFESTLDSSGDLATPVFSANVSIQSLGDVAVRPDGQYLYLAIPSSSPFKYYSTSSTIGSSAGASTTFGALASFIRIDYEGKYLISLQSTTSTSVRSFLIDSATGNILSAAISAPAAPDSAPSMALDPTGRFLLIPNTATGQINRYLLDRATGTLTIQSGFPVPGGGGVFQGITIVKRAQ